MSNRAIYAIIAVVAVAAIAGFYLMIRGDSDAAPTAQATKPAERSGAGSSGFAPSDRGPAQIPGRDPQLPPGTPDDLPPKVKEYAANGAIVRDHRSGSRTPIEPDPNAAPPNGRKLEPTLTKSIADRVRDVMHECVAAMPANVRGERPRLEGLINIAIKDKVVSIKAAQLVVKDVIGDAAETTRKCIETKSLAVTQAAGDEPDLPSYDINLSFNLI